MKAKELLKKVMRNYMDIEGSGVIEFNEFSSLSVYFNVADECDVDDGEYFYTYLEDEQEMKDTEKFLGQPFDYAFPLRDCDEWVGLVRIED